MFAEFDYISHMSSIDTEASGVFKCSDLTPKVGRKILAHSLLLKKINTSLLHLLIFLLKDFQTK